MYHNYIGARYSFDLWASTVLWCRLMVGIKGGVLMKRHLILIIFCVWLGSTGFVSGSFQIYSKAVKFAKAGKSDFAFMYYSKLLRNYPMSKYRDKALFATGEYYFKISGFQQASEAFQTFVDEFPNSEERLYALAYLLSIANKAEDELFAQGLERQIINLQQVSFVFRESKEIVYRSPLYQNYKAIIHIDKIELYVEGELFAKVSY